MPQSFFILSGEHLELGADEVISISKSYDTKTTYAVESKLVIIKSNTPWQKIAERATFVRACGNISGTFNDISEIEISVQPPKSFVCRAINLSSKKINVSNIERDAGAILERRLGSSVSLSNPSLIVYLIIADKARYVGYADGTITPRRPKKTIKYPTELDWKLSRCIVNLSQLKEGDTLCDPFCGTGTTLLEAESMGMHSIGIDYDFDMCNITRRNLVENGYESRVVNSTHQFIPKIKKKIDAIVTDVPYGIASRSSVPPKKIIEDLLSVVPKKMKLVLVYKKGSELTELSGAKRYEIYRHKSLTRVIAVR
ncbi:MAG: DNA methyltransferase [Nitrosotalea sp.]